MPATRTVKARRSCAALLAAWLVLPSLWAASAPGADRPARQPEDYFANDEILDEVLVIGRKPVNSAQKMSAWLSRLVGEFRYAGHVERQLASGSLQQVEIEGTSQCATIDAPGIVRCLTHVQWPEATEPRLRELPGGASWIAPAVSVFAINLEPSNEAAELFLEPQYIGHMQVDARGIAEIGMGQLFDDTLVYSSPCVDYPGTCRRIVRITAPPDGKVVRMSVEVTGDSGFELRYEFQWHRAPKSQAAAIPASPIPKRDGSAIIPADNQAWLQRLAGSYRAIIPTAECQMSKHCSQDRSIRAECQGIGSGPGVYCTYSVAWPESRQPGLHFGGRFDLWGYDPITRRVAIAYAETQAMDGLGGATFAFGSLRNNRLTVNPLCNRRKCGTSYYTIKGDRNVEQKGNSTPLMLLTRIVDEPAASKTSRVRSPSPRRP